MGQFPFDLPLADLAVRALYQESGLREPGRILWADGPDEAARLVAFVRTPPRRLRHFASVLTAVGAAVFAGMAVMAERGMPAGAPDPRITLLGIAAAIGLVWASERIVPLPPGPRSGRPGLWGLVAGSAIFAALVLYVIDLRDLGVLLGGPVGLSFVAVFGALLGAVPGMFLYLRLRCDCADVPASLLEIVPDRSVASMLQGRHGTGWSLFGRATTSLAIDESQLLARDFAHREAFSPRDWRGFFAESTRRAAAAADWGPPAGISQGWQQVSTRWMPDHLDGFEYAARSPLAATNSGLEQKSWFAELAFQADRLYPFRTVAIGVKPATTVATDAEGRLHSENGPALAWDDGTEIFAWHGHPVDADLAGPDLPVTRRRIEREFDLIRRRVLIERYGLGRYLEEAAAREIQHDDCGRLYRLRQSLDEPIVAVRVTNGTPEPDGSVREFWLRVPPGTETARAAVAWTFGLLPQEYRPSAES